MSNHFVTKEVKDRVFSCMRSNGITSSDLCRVLNVNYCDFKATFDGKSPCYGKWQKKIAEVLNADKEELFKEFYQPQMSEADVRADERLKAYDGFAKKLIAEVKGYEASMGGVGVGYTVFTDMVKEVLAQLKGETNG